MFWLSSGAVLGLLGATQQLRAQDSVSQSLSAESTESDGFNTGFESESSNLTNGSLHTDVSDPTHSQLDGSLLAPADNVQVLSYVYAEPATGTLTDAQAAVNRQDFAFGGKHSQSFSAGSATAASYAARAASLATLGGGTMQSAFSANAGGRAAFSGQAVPTGNTGMSFSGEGVAIPATEQGVGVKQTLSSTGVPEVQGAYLATDPVLSGSSSGFETDLQLNGDAPAPSIQVQQAFADSNLPVTQYQYDDGQTPSLVPSLRAGGVLSSGIPTEYLESPTGFPDSTKGLAGQPTERSNTVSPLTSALSPSSATVESPFAPVSSGTVYGMKERLNPTLHAATTEPGGSTVPLYARRAEQARITRGVSITDSAAMYRQDMQAYHRERAGERRRPTLEELDTPNRQAAAGMTGTTRTSRTTLPHSLK